VSAPFRFALFVAVALGLVAPAAFGMAKLQTAQSAVTPARLDGGKKLYRQFCGQCHSLKEARAVGFGAASPNGPGDLGGPSFNPLRVTAQQCLLAIQGVWDGHSRVITHMTHDQIRLVGNYVQAATKDHPHKATLPSDSMYG
jgi:mono/diheme cytochrome c family protein